MVKIEVHCLFYLCSRGLIFVRPLTERDIRFHFYVTSMRTHAQKRADFIHLLG